MNQINFADSVMGNLKQNKGKAAKKNKPQKVDNGYMPKKKEEPMEFDEIMLTDDYDFSKSHIVVKKDTGKKKKESDSFKN